MGLSSSLINNINALSEAELIELSHAVCRNITAIRTRRMDGIRDLLSVGDNVTFTGRHRGRNGGRFPVTGTVTKIKRKNAEVRANGMTWNVNISQLTRVSS
jgi:hypothetical protein